MICFVYRSPYHGVLGKHVRWLPDASVLDWFRRAWDEAAADPDAWLRAELGADVYGLDSIFDEARHGPLPKPGSMAELRKLLKKHLYVEGKVIVDEHSVRALTDDDEVPWPTSSSTRASPSDVPAGSPITCGASGRCPPGPPRSPATSRSRRSSCRRSVTSTGTPRAR
jgi:hypothetical protein